ncbi:MAG TPA: AAA family ATPase, partial [Solirubrobacteraceae bacterium]|nr:AAA family ATPase [Solirubrobacteraceae bacterium]
RDRLVAAAERAAQEELAARTACERLLAELRAADDARTDAESELRAAERSHAEAAEARRRTQWLIEQRRAAPAQGALAVRQAEIEGELAAERRQSERRERERRERQARVQRLERQRTLDAALAPRSQRLAGALQVALAGVQARLRQLERELAADREAGEEMTVTLRACAAEEAEIQSSLRACGESVTEAEVAAQRLRDRAAEAELECASIAEGLGFASAAAEPQGEAGELEGDGGEPQGEAGEPQGEGEEPQGAREDDAVQAGAWQPLQEEQAEALRARVERLTRRREQLGPVNPLAQEEYAQALAHVEELESQRSDLETALRELRSVIRETDRQIQETFEETFAAAARNFEELAGEVFPGGGGRLRLVREEQAPRPVLGGQPLPSAGEDGESGALVASGDPEEAAEAESESERHGEEEQLPGVEIEITPAGKSTKRLTLLSGGEKSMTALAFLFAVFLARPCPFYILDEVEAALDDLNLSRFLTLLRRYSSRAQFIVITHQKRTMEAADWLFGVSMGQDGVSRVLSRRLPAEDEQGEGSHEERRGGEVAALA